MNEIQPSQWNSDMPNVTCSEEYYHGISAAETIILPSLIGIICSTGLVGNVLIMITIISEFSPYKTGTRDCVIDLIQKLETKSTTPAAVSLSNLLQNCYYLPEHLSKMMQSRSWMLPDGFSKVREKLLSKSRKKSIPDIYICNLAVADLVHITGMPFLIHQWARGGEWVFGSPLCTIITSLDTCNQFACSAIMTVMSLDRYLALVQPFRLTSLRTRSKTIRVNLCLWAISLILAFPVWTYSKVITFKDGLESCAFDLTSPEEILWYTLYVTIATFFFPLPLIMVCYILILRYTWELYQENKQAGCYNTGIPRQRLIRLTKMVLVLVGVFVLSVAPYHVLQLVNLWVAQPTPAFYIGYYFSICLSYASGSINPFLYILLSGNFQKRLRQCMNVKVKTTERDVNNIETTPKSSF